MPQRLAHRAWISPLAKARWLEELQELQVQAHAVGDGPRAATDRAGGDGQVVLVHQSGRDGLVGQRRPVGAGVVRRPGLEASDGVRVGGASDPGPSAGDLLQRGGVPELLRHLPAAGVLGDVRRHAGQAVGGLRDVHRLDHPPVEMRADRAEDVADDGAHLRDRCPGALSPSAASASTSSEVIIEEMSPPMPLPCREPPARRP